MVYALVYASRATNPMARPDLLALLSRARARNSALEITGILLFRNQTFLQLLEGERAAVTDLYAAIRRDPRHHDVQTVWTDPDAARQFADWSMAFSDLDEEPVTADGYNDLFDRPADPVRPETELLRDLLELFDART